MFHNGDSQLIVHGFIYISQILCYHGWKKNAILQLTTSALLHKVTKHFVLNNILFQD
jgi:hypothetical protein